MNRPTVKGLVLFTATAVALAVAPASSALAAPASAEAGAATIPWGQCASPGLQRRGAECGLLSVPLDYSKPNGKKIQIAVSRIKAKVAAKDYQGVMLVNPGGPGGSGLTLSVLGEFVPNDAGLAYDWIGFDPRGVGSSVPALSCDPDYFNGPRPEYIPWNQNIERTWLGLSKGYAKDCGQAGGDLLKHMTTVDSVNDMESIRKALGAKQINYYGFSYGTYLGQVYGTLHPDKVRRMVLDGNVDVRKVWYQANLDQDVNFERNVNIWFGWLAKYDSVYHLGKTAQQVSARWYAEKEKLRANPAGGVVGPDEWTDIFLYSGYYQSTWLELADAFAGWANDHNTDIIVAAYEGYVGPGDDNGFAVYNAVQCTDVQWPQSWNQWERDNWRTFLKAPFMTWDNAWYNAPCLFWPAKASKPVKVDGSKVKSVLFVGTTLDAATPFEGSLEARRRFPHGALLAEVGQTTHANSLNGNACIDDTIAEYLATGKLPDRKRGDRADKTCDALPQPDPTAASAQAKSFSTDSSLVREPLYPVHH
ncbi:alpha/beta hydrolase [Dactylosporangium sp. AC04546]|uniref:alpha/beta hydrolase n=1 Tax=Dactylosporangium sp. AC04546 TaxID=2862460 RepID=UPI001EE01A09|nr:alpha/beta hydrolase [Dactylosporangium sp. AC04546]WVK83698.1 alpha/beta hydrolase [Dactylosporangium sp. AC04546]